MNARTAALILAALIGLAATPARADTDCAAPENLVYVDAALPRVGEALRRHEPLTIAVVGTSSASGAGVSDESRAFPTRLAVELKRRLPNETVSVAVYARRGDTAADMLARIKSEIVKTKPTLVIWQTGTVDAIRGAYPGQFGGVLIKGIETLQKAGSDVMLMNMQFSPQAWAVINLEPYLDNMTWVAQVRDVLLFDRYGLMKYWDQTGTFDLNATKDAALRTGDKVHACIGRLLADMILAAAKTDDDKK
jgi:lysophospholipase L1-like esterase